MNYSALKKKMQERASELIDKRNILCEERDYIDNYETIKLTGQIIGLYEAIIMVQDMEIEELSGGR